MCTVCTSKLHVACRSTVEPRYNEVLGTMESYLVMITVSHYIGIKKIKKYKELVTSKITCVITGFCYIKTYFITRFHCT